MHTFFLVVLDLFSFFGRLEKLNFEIEHKMKIKYSGYITALAMASTSLFLTGCGGESTPETPKDAEDEIQKIDEKITKDTKPDDIIRVKVGNQFFSIPSPVQTAFLIKKEGADFNSELLNPIENSGSYSTTFQKALNMGVYGADMGYITLYENTDLSLKYLKGVRKLADELDLAGAFNDKLAERFSANMGNQDSMLVFVNEAYKNADDYLKKNDKADVAALVVVGGWVEAVYFAAQTAVETKNQKIIDRVAEQKQALTNMINMLKALPETSGDESYEDLVLELEDLRAIFDDITFTYEYVEPVTDPVKKETAINSKNTVEISDESLNQIVKTLSEIRNSIIG